MNSVQQQNLQNTAGTYTTNNQQNMGAAQLPVQNPVSAPNTAPVQNICYPPQYYYGTQTNSTPYYPAGGSGVTINILNPVGNAAPGSISQIPYCIPMQQPVNQQPPAQSPIPATPLPEQKPAPVEEPKKKDEPKKEIVQLTDDYVKSLENYLNNPNADVRLLGAKELLNRFKEDKSRKNDQALNNLLNKALRDSSQTVRLIALSALDSDVADGDSLTYKILQNMQKSSDVYNQDSVTAAQIMLKKAGKKLNVESKDSSASSQEIQPQTGNKLNVTAG